MKEKSFITPTPGLHSEMMCPSGPFSMKSMRLSRYNSNLWVIWKVLDPVNGCYTNQRYCSINIERACVRSNTGITLLHIGCMIFLQYL